MPINPAILQTAFVATPNPAGSAPFGSSGDGLVIKQFNQPVFVKFAATAGHSYTVSTNVIPGDLVVLGPNGFPLNPGTAIKAFTFTPLTSGIYTVEMVANPRFVATGQVIHVGITQDSLGLPITIGGALDPGSIAGNLGSIVNGILSGGQKFFLHMPDGNPNGLGVAAPEGSAGPPAPVALPEAQGPAGLATNSQGEAGIAGTPMTPLETTPSGKPLTWVGSNDAPGAGNVVSWAVAQYNYQSDAQTATFKGPFPAAFVPLVKEAFAEWASLANIKPVQVNDVSSSPPQPPDIRVGLSDLLSNIGPPVVGFTHPKYDANGKLSPDTLVSIENPTQMPVTALSNGDFQYKGFDTTVLQVALHEVGHALGLAENPNDPTSIMNPSLTRLNRVPDAQDIAAIRYLYGPPSTHTA